MSKAKSPTKPVEVAAKTETPPQSVDEIAQKLGRLYLVLRAYPVRCEMIRVQAHMYVSRHRHLESGPLRTLPSFSPVAELTELEQCGQTIASLVGELLPQVRGSSNQLDHGIKDAGTFVTEVARVLHQVRATVNDDLQQLKIVLQCQVPTTMHVRSLDSQFVETLYEKLINKELLPKLHEYAETFACVALPLSDGKTGQPEKQFEAGDDRRTSKEHDTEEPTHSADFTSVNWFGAPHHFNKTQAECVKLLWTEWEKGGLSLSEKTIGDAIDSSSDHYRLAHTFRDRNGEQHAAWGTMIRPAGKGIFCLRSPNHQ